MTYPEICRIDDLHAIRGSLEQKPLRYLHLLWLLEQSFPYDVYVDRPEAPNHFLTVVNYGRDDQVAQIESSSPSWVSTVLGHVPLAEPVGWIVTNLAVIPVIEGAWEVQWKQTCDLVCKRIPHPVQTDATVRHLEEDDVTAVASSLADDGSFSDPVIRQTTSRLTSPETVSYGAFVDEELVAWVLASPVISQVWDVEFIYTRPAWRGRGYASALAAAYATEVLLQGRIPYYSSPANEASRRAAERAGFVVHQIRTYSISTKARGR